MLRTAFAPALAAWLKEPAVIEVMQRPDGRLSVDRLTTGLADNWHRLSPADRERMILLIAHHVDVEVNVLRFKRHVTVCSKVVALFVCFWRGAAPPLPAASRVT